MVQAAIDVNGISPSQKIRLADEIFAQHPQTLTARDRFNEGLPKDLADQMVQQFCDEHRQRYLLAFVYGYLGDNELMQARTDAEKYLMLADPKSRGVFGRGGGHDSGAKAAVKVDCLR